MYQDGKQTTIIRNHEITCSDGHKIALDIFHPEGITKDSAALLFVHGGGFISGDKDQFLGMASYLALKQGIVCVSVQYRTGTGNPYPNAVFDCIEATEWIAKNAESLSVDKTKIFCLGGSPGANIILLAMQKDWRERHCSEKQKKMFYSKNMILLNCIFSISSLLEKNSELRAPLSDYFKTTDKEILDDASPSEMDYSGFNMLLLHGECDKVVPAEECRAFHKRLNKTNNMRIEIFPGEAHAWFNDIYKQYAVLEKIENFIYLTEGATHAYKIPSRDV